MDTILFKYSQFFDDDGGLQQVKKDFFKLSDDLINEANRVKKEVNDAFNFGDKSNLDKQEKQVENLADTFEKLTKAQESIVKVEEEYQKIQKKGNATTKDQIDALAELDKNLNNYRLDLKKANQLEKDGIRTGEDFNKVRVEAQLNIKKTQTEIRKLQKEILEQNKLSKEEEKLLKAKIVLQKQEINSVNDIRERLAALRVVRNQVNIATEEGREALFEYNQEIDDLTELLKDSSDQFTQNKINIGNYEESIVEALKSQSLFTTGLGGLDSALAGVLGLLLLNNEALEKMEESNKKNTTAIKRFAIAFARLNKVLKASIIGVVLLAIAALSSAFGNTRAGAVRLEKIMTTLSTAFTTFGRVASTIFKGVGEAFVILFDSIKALSDISLKDLFTGDFNLADIFGNAGKQFVNIKKTFDEVVDLVQNGQEAIVKGLDNIDRAFQLEDRVRRLNQEIERLNGLLSVSQSIADDSTKSLATQLLANERSLELAEEIGEKQLEIAKAELEAANERIKQNILANGVEAKSLDLSQQGEAFAKSVLDLAEQRGVQLEISNDLLEEQQAAVVEVIKTENELLLTREENAKKQREIQRDLFEQNLDLLIDLIDTEKNLSEQFVNDVTRNFERRVNEFNRFLVRFRENAQRELNEFTKFAQNNGLDLDFQVGFDENGNLQVFVNDTELAIDNIIQLNEQLQGLGIDEITINRFREFIVEARNGVKDFRDLNKELTLVGINVQELSSNLAQDRLEIDELDELFKKIRQLSAIDQSRLSKKERDEVLKELKKLEDEKTAIIKRAEGKRRDNRIDAIDEELKTVEDGSQRQLELLRERAALEKQIREDVISDTIDEINDANKRAAENFKKFADDLNALTGLVLDRLAEINQQRVEDSEKRVEKQEQQVTKQEDRAREGLENTLAFEQKALAEREAELIKQQKRQERLEKIKALYSAYNGYAQNGDAGDAIVKTLRDFAILESIAATFKDGGIVGVDGVKTNNKGITVGASHNPNGKGGNLAWHERGEGFLNRKEVSNMGHSNFYALKRLAGSGPLSENFFTGQRDKYIAALHVPEQKESTVKELREVKKAIQNKPVPELNVPEVVDGILKFVETVHTNNSKKRNHYRIDKSRI